MQQQTVSHPIQRQVSRVIQGVKTHDGAGVSLTRVIGQNGLMMLDPFLLLDVFESNDPDDYIAGFPPHPHRGFETVTYLLAGKMRHKDSAGHEGVIEAGGVQWMTAGHGIVHSEMPEQERGRLAGFQLWVNLPAAHKMDQPRYQEFTPDQIPVERRENGVLIRVIAGQTHRGTSGLVRQPLTDPTYLHVTLEPGKRLQEVLAADHNAFVYQIGGTLTVESQQPPAVMVKPLPLSQGSLSSYR